MNPRAAEAMRRFLTDDLPGNRSQPPEDKEEWMKLSMIETNELRACLKKGFTIPRFVGGDMDKQQWRAWKRLERLQLAVIEGSGEADDLAITDKGRIFIENAK